MFFRSLVIIVLLSLFLEPRIEFEKEKILDLNWNIYVDRSLSMAYHSHPSSVSFVSGIDKFSKKLNQKGIHSSVIGFGSGLDSAWTKGYKKLDAFLTYLLKI